MWIPLVLAAIERGDLRLCDDDDGMTERERDAAWWEARAEAESNGRANGG